MLSDEFKQRIGCILGLEEHGDDADWFAIATLSAEILTELPESAPLAVRAYLTDFDIRRVSPPFRRHQQRAIVRYLKS